MLNVSDIVAEIEKRAGRQDAELEFRPNMEHFVAALNSDNKLSELGEASVRKSLVDRTGDRLEGLRWLRDFPEADGQVITEPVFLTG